MASSSPRRRAMSGLGCEERYASLRAFCDCTQGSVTGEAVSSAR